MSGSLSTSPLLVGLLVGGAVALGLLLSPLAAIVTGGAGAAVLLVLAQAQLTRSFFAARLDQLAAAPPGPPWLGFLDLVSEGLMALDERRTVVYLNPAAAALLGRAPEEILGQPLIRAAWSSELASVVADAEGFPREIAFEGGRAILASASVSGEPHPLTLVVLSEVSAVRRAERSRIELVANLSHELRTPIAAARALAETLEGGVDEAERRERYQRQLLAEIDRLSGIVERALRLSRIEAGAERLDVAPVEPARLIQAAIVRLAPLADARAVTLSADLGDALPRALADFDRAVEVLTLLLDNAIKFSPAGQPVSVGASSLEDGFVTFEVRDLGPGVLPAERERVFERLYTGDRSRAAQAGAPSGYGLGLAIARHLVARMGGRIWVAEVEGPGAAFRFTLPQAPGEDATGQT